MIELLVVVALLGLLASILLPALSRSRAQADRAVCLNAKRQMGIAWLAYASDNYDKAMWNDVGGYASRGADWSIVPNWVPGFVSWYLFPQNTNGALLLDPEHSSMSQYAGREVSIYRCPADQFVSDAQRKQGWGPRVRSVAMNKFIGGPRGKPSGHYRFRTLIYAGGLTQLSPADAWLIVDEHPDRINDPLFEMDPNGEPSGWWDFPASYHRGGTSFLFVDGHAATHRWRSEEMRLPVIYSNMNLAPRTDSGGDWKWFIRRTAETNSSW